MESDIFCQYRQGTELFCCSKSFFFFSRAEVKLFNYLTCHPRIDEHDYKFGLTCHLLNRLSVRGHLEIDDLLSWESGFGLHVTLTQGQC